MVFMSKIFDQTQLLELFFDNTVCASIVSETKLYAFQKGNHIFEFDMSDLQLFFAILIISGLSPTSRRRAYWSIRKAVRNEAISQAMLRNRFYDIMHYVHLADNDNLTSGDRYGKVRPLIDMQN